MKYLLLFSAPRPKTNFSLKVPLWRNWVYDNHLKVSSQLIVVSFKGRGRDVQLNDFWLIGTGLNITTLDPIINR